jgi:hypothetical protein
MSHTPGPWGWNRDETSIGELRGFGITDADHLVIIPPEAIDNEADARLIAAAPDLLAALEQLLERHEALVAWGAQVLTWETPVLIPGASQPLVVEQLLPQELISGRGGSRELLWGQDDVDPPVMVARAAIAKATGEPE